MREGCHRALGVIVDEFESDRTTFYYCVPHWLDKSVKHFCLGLIALTLVVFGVYDGHYYWGLIVFGAILGVGAFLWAKYDAEHGTIFVKHCDVATVISSYLPATTPYVWTHNGEYPLDLFLREVEHDFYRRRPFNVSGDFILAYYADEEVSTRSEGHLMTVKNVKGEVAITVYHEQLRPPYHKHLAAFQPQE